MAALATSLATGLPAQAVQFPQTSIVSENPQDNTPNILNNADQVADPAEVDAIAQVAGTVVLGGTFHQVQEVGAPTPVTRDYLLAFDAATGVVSTTFTPVLDGAVDAVLPAGDGTSVFISGLFNHVDGVAMASIARLDLATGALTAGFVPPHMNGEVRDLRLVAGQLVLAGNFTRAGKVARGQMASLNPATGTLTGFISHAFSGPLNGGILKVIKIDVTPDGSKLVGIGNFSSVDGQARSQVFMLNTAGATATLAPWATTFFAPGCSVLLDSYMRGLDISPDGSYAVISTSGAYFGATSQCDTVTRWDLTSSSAGQQPVWREVTGGDTTSSVAVTATAVYTGGHFRWSNNPYARDSVGEGAVPREGLAALDPLTGLPMTWNPGRARGIGVFVMLATSTGLWVGSDTDQAGGEAHGKIAFFPLAGGVTPPPNAVQSLPEDIYLMGAATSAPGVAPVTYGDTIDRQFWIGPGYTPEATANPPLGGTWSDARGSFLVDSTIYSPWADSTVLARSFDGTTLGAPTSIPLFANGTDPRAFAADVASITGIFYANNRVYYTLTGDPNLYWRYFTPQSQVFGAVRGTVGGAVSALNPLRVSSMFVSGSTVFIADSGDGHLYTVALTGGSIASPGSITGSATLVDTTIDWRSRAAFVWNAAPAPRPNTPPIAKASASCVMVTCTFDASGSFDPDGHIVSYAWDFGDGTTGSGAGATLPHSYATAGTYTATLTVTDIQGATTSTTVSVTPTRAHYTPVTPCRVFDTRTGKGTCTGAATVAKSPVGPGATLPVRVTNVAGVPATATAVVLNVTAVAATGPTFVTVWPQGTVRPVASNLNVASAAATPNLVVVPVGVGGSIDLYNASGEVDLIADLAGYFSPTSTASYTAVSPCRLFDTRYGTASCSAAPSVRATPVAARTALSVQVTGAASIPADATAVVLNVTAVSATADTYVTVFPHGAATPLTSNLNVHSAAPVPNLVIVPIGAGGMVDFVSAAGTVNLIADVAGYFSPTATSGYTPTGPCRVFDTRSGTGACPAAGLVTALPVGPGATLSVQVVGVAGVPANATAVVLNVTAVAATGATFVTVFPDGGLQPIASNLNVNSARATPNLVVVPIGSDGKIDFYNARASVHLIADIAGYFCP